MIEEVGIFFARKETPGGSKLRVLFGCRRPNLRCKPPPKTELAGSSTLGDVWVDSEEPLHATSADVKDFFYRILLPESFRPLFGLKPVALKLLKHPSAREWEARGYTHVPMRLRVIPMGWTWSLWVAQKLHEGVLESDEELNTVELLGGRRPAPIIRGSRVGGIVYVDDAGFIGIRPAQLQRLHERYQIRMEESGYDLHPGKSHGPLPEDIKLGFKVNGLPCTVEPKPQKWIRIHRSLRHLLRLDRVRGVVVLECVLGNLVVYGLLRRPYLSIFSEVYKVLEAFDRRGRCGRVRITPALRREIYAAMVLLPLLTVALRDPPAEVVCASDSSDTHYCLGRSWGDRERIFETMSYDERWKHSPFYKKNTSKRQAAAESATAKLIERGTQAVEPNWHTLEHREVLRITRRTAASQWTRHGWGLSRKDSPWSVEDEVEQWTPSILPGASDAPAGLFWEVNTWKGGATLWANHEGARVATPCARGPLRTGGLQSDAAFEAAQQFLESNAVRWIVLHLPPSWPDEGKPRCADLHVAVRRMVVLAEKVVAGGGKATWLGPWNSRGWKVPALLNMRNSPGFGIAQIDRCYWRPYRLTIKVLSNDERVQKGSLICPGRSHPSHAKHLQAKGRRRVEGGYVPTTELNEDIPVAVVRWLARCAILSLEEMRADEPGDFDATRRQFPIVPRELVEEATWSLYRVGRWRYETEDIYVKEARASIMGIQETVSSFNLSNCRILTLLDNEAAVMAFNKGRAKHPTVLKLCRKALSVSFLHNLRLKWRHLAGHRMPCDGPTRPHLFKEREDGSSLAQLQQTGRCRGGSQPVDYYRDAAALREGDYSSSVMDDRKGWLLSNPSCLSLECPPGLCCCEGAWTWDTTSGN